MDIWIGKVIYGNSEKQWLAKSGHYLDNSLPGCLFAVGVKIKGEGLFGAIGDGPLLGLCLIGRPCAPGLPQDKSIGEVSRMVLLPGLPYATASAVLLVAADIARARRMKALIAYHDRTIHSGCIYKKAGFKKDGQTLPRKSGWGNRPGRTKSEAASYTSKRRWRLDL